MHSPPEPPRPAGLSRRQFSQYLLGAAALGLVDTATAARWLGDPKRLSWRAHRTAGAEGFWPLEEVEGEVPGDLHGTLYRTTPGESERFGVRFRHLFDGDAYLSGYSFRDGAVTLRAQFVAHPGRAEELRAGEMLYSEFGTPAPRAEGERPRGGKNQPSVNLIAWDGRLLGLSEGGPPTAFDPETLASQGFWDFHGTLPRGVAFTAHPKFDPNTGAGYAFGFSRGQRPALVVFRMELDGRLTKLYELPQRGYFMVHDMLLSQDHLVFTIPPVSYDGRTMQAGGTPGEALRYAEDGALRVLVLAKDGGAGPVEVELPAAMVFHHGNAFARDGVLHLDSFVTPDGSILEQLHAWSKDELPPMTGNQAVRLAVDLEKQVVVARDVFGATAEFPRFDERHAGSDVRHLYTAGRPAEGDPFAFQALERHDRHRGTSEVREVAAHQTVAEPVFAPRGDGEGDGWLLQLGYDGRRDRTFLDVVDAQTLDRAARVWLPMHLPLGFHGNFVAGSFVRA